MDSEQREVGEARSAVDRLLRARGITTLRFSKPTFTKPAPADLRHEIATRCDAVIEALAD